jgi:hypothetical protein
MFIIDQFEVKDSEGRSVIRDEEVVSERPTLSCLSGTHRRLCGRADSRWAEGDYMVRLSVIHCRVVNMLVAFFLRKRPNHPLRRDLFLRLSTIGHDDQRQVQGEPGSTTTPDTDTKPGLDPSSFPAN